MSRDKSDEKPMAVVSEQGPEAQPGAKVLTPAARRALEEADARRKAAAAKEAPNEIGGRDGPDPARYGDWEKGGIASDF